MSSNLDYFTYWNALSYAIGFTALCGCKVAHKEARWLAVYLICSSLVVCIIGTWVLAFRMKIPRQFHRKVLRTQLWLHVMPLVLSFMIISIWPILVGKRATSNDAMLGLLGLAVLFTAWCSIPESTSRATFLKKIEVVYQTEESLMLVCIGIVIAGVASLTCCFRSEKNGTNGHI